MKTPGSRLRDDLYALYLVVFLWFVLPAYGNALALVLPSDSPHFDRALDIGAAVLGLVAVWWGRQGGPLVLSRATVLHELGSPSSRVRRLSVLMIRQALAVATFAGLVLSVLLALHGGARGEILRPAQVSIAAALASAAAVFQSTVWLVVLRGREGPRPLLAALSAALAVALVGLVASGGSISTPQGLAFVGVLALVSGALAAWSLRWVPVDRLWQRAAITTRMQALLQVFYLHGALLLLREAGTPAQAASTRLLRDRMPLPLWRQLAGMQRGALGHAVRTVAVAATLAAVLLLGDPRDGLVIAASACLGTMLGFEFCGPLAATTQRPTFSVHYPRGSRSVLQGQLAVVLLLTLAVSALAVGWLATRSPTSAAVGLALCGYGALGASVQARLGSPNLGAFVDGVAAQAMGPLLWARAMIGPAIVLVGAIALVHGWLRVDVSAPISATHWALVHTTTLALAVAGVTWPLYRRVS